jgi:GNAT superfamily N-acetyltransferase
MPSINNMTQSEVSIAIEWAAQEGWNPGISDASSFYLADPKGFFISKLGNQAVAVISAVRYGEQFGFIGLYIVHPDYRGRGFGWEIWQVAMNHLQGIPIGLDGVVAQQSNYKKSGFEFVHRNIRYSGRSQKIKLELDGNYGSIVSLDQIPFSMIQAFDRSFFPQSRAGFLFSWISQPDSFALGLIADGVICGYGVIRPCRVGFKIGPLFANSEFAAEKLYSSLCACVSNDSPIFLDIPECNLRAIALVDRHQMQPMFETARMYKGYVGNLRIEDTYGITSFELG